MSSRRSRRVKNPDRVVKTFRRQVSILAVVTLIAFISALPGEFIWSDKDYIVNGTQRIQSFQDVIDMFRYSAQQYRTHFDGPPTNETRGSWQPVVTFDFTLGWSVWRNCSFCFRLEGVVLHFLTVVGFLAFGRHLLSQRRGGTSVAFWAAMGFSVHPVAVSVIASSQGRPVLLATALAIWGMLIFIRLPATSKSHQRPIPRWPVWLTVVTAAAVGAWELALAMPFAALLVAWFDSWERDRPGIRGISRSRRQGLLILFATAIAFLIGRLTIQGNIGFAGTYPSANVLGNIGTALRLFWQHLSVIFIPGEPVVSDAFRITTTWSAVEVAALLGLTIWIAITITGLWLRHPAAIGGTWLLLWSLPVTGLFPTLRYYSEAALYPAYWGAMFGIAYFIVQLWRPIGRQMTRGSEAIVLGPILLVVVFISALSNVRFWSDDTLFESEVDNDPYYIEGRSILTRLAFERGLTTESLEQAMMTIEASQDRKFTGFYPKFDVYRLLGNAQTELELFDGAEASFDTAIGERPSSASAHHGLGRALLGLGDVDGAIAAFTKAIESRPSFLPAQSDLGIAIVRKGQPEQGLELLASGVANGLDGYARRVAMANALLAMNELRHAQRHLEKALNFRETADTRAKLAFVQWKRGDTSLATENINIALQLDEISSEYVLSVARQITQRP